MPWKRDKVTDINTNNNHAEDDMGEEEESDWRDWPKLIRSCLCEFVGLILFVFVGSLSFQAESLIVAACAHGLTIALLILAFGHISGGHFNPAVTLGALIAGGIHIVHAICYWIFQLLGAFVGALFVRAALRFSVYMSINGGTTNISDDNSYEGMAFLTEVIITYILVNSVLMTAVDTSSQTLAPLAIGFSVLVGILSGGSNSGGSMNPARSFGPAAAYSIFGNCSEAGVPCVVSPSTVWRYHWVHWAGPLLGAAFAGMLYRYVYDGAAGYLYLRCDHQDLLRPVIETLATPMRDFIPG